MNYCIGDKVVLKDGDIGVMTGYNVFCSSQTTKKFSVNSDQISHFLFNKGDKILVLDTGKWVVEEFVCIDPVSSFKYRVRTGPHDTTGFLEASPIRSGFNNIVLGAIIETLDSLGLDGPDIGIGSRIRNRQYGKAEYEMMLNLLHTYTLKSYDTNSVYHCLAAIDTIERRLA